MNKNENMKIFDNNLNKNPKSVLLRSKLNLVGKTKYLPSFSKEWRNIIYSFNKNNLKNIPANDVNVNKIIQSYFDLFFKNKFIGSSKRVQLLKRRKFLRRIFVSNVEIKHTNNKAKITLYTINREKKILKEKYMKLYKKISFKLFKDYIYLYKNHISNIYSFLSGTNNGALAKTLKIKNEYFFEADLINKKNYLSHKWNYLQIFLKLNNLLLRKTWSLLIKNQAKNYIRLLRRYNLLYSLNQFKFNKLILLPKLSNLLSKIIGKKVEYNIVNLKSISYNTDLFTKILALKIQKIKQGHVRRMLAVINKAYLPKVNTIQERTKVQTWDNIDEFQNKYKDLKIISNLVSSTSTKKENISELLTTVYNEDASSENIHNSIYNSIGYKNMRGIKIEVKGRLTKRYRADRSVYSLKRKGGLKNINSSFQGLSSVLFRGNTNSNVSYSWAKSKRRVGAFAVKGWIAGK
uniref:Ribosomal protein S3 n=1 Tax=Clonostachys rogersoniana TaxID=122658 RepID=A0A8F2BR18_CLORO|nr:ribosomal protein S3 [Clonostachys rogersoniana]